MVKGTQVRCVISTGWMLAAVLAHILVHLLYLPVELCATDGAITLLPHGVYTVFLSCLNKLLHQLSTDTGNCPSTQHTYNGVSYQNHKCYR